MNMKILLILAACSFYLAACQTKTRPKEQDLGPAKSESRFVIHFADTLSTNWIVLQSNVFNKPSFLLIDNGTTSQQQLILFKHYAASKGIIDSTVFFGAEMKRIENLPAPLSIDDFRDTVRTELQPVHNAPIHKMPDGILGKGFLTKYILAIDYNAKTLQIIDHSAFKVPEDYQIIEMKPTGPFYSFSADFFIQEKHFTEDLYLDLGNGLDGFLFGLKFYNSLKEKIKIEGREQRESFSQFSKSRVASILVDSVIISGIVIKKIPSTIETSSSASYLPLLIGNSVLRQFGKVIFDLGHNRMYLRYSK